MMSQLHGAAAAVLHRGPMRARRVAVSLVSAALTLAAAEMAARYIDGHRFDRLRLEARGAPSEHPGKWQEPEDVRTLAGRVPLAAGVDPRWFSLQIPPPSRREPDPELAARARHYPGLELQATYEWNRRYVDYALCNEAARRFSVFDKLADVYVFEPADDDRHPTFRFLRDASYPSGLQTNAFGWRGSQVSLYKPPGTIRVAFLGASTTIGEHGEAFSYPEFVEVWLNLWAAANHPRLRFEVLNTAREGTDTWTMRAVVRSELPPLEPDLILFYEGSNHFWPADFISAAPLPPKPIMHVEDHPGALARHSALAARLRGLVLRGPVAGEEPDKPSLPVAWPADLDELAPDVADLRLPTNLANVTSHFDDMRRALDGTGTRLALSSFTWLVDDGLRLDPRRDAGIFRFLNDGYWPFSYAHLRRYADFQNRVYRRYAERHGLDFIDYDAHFPRDPRLFYDAIHLTRAGVRLQAWIMLQGLVRIIEPRLASGEWPRSDLVAQEVHPAFSAPRQLVAIAALGAGCRPAAP